MNMKARFNDDIFSKDKMLVKEAETGRNTMELDNRIITKFDGFFILIFGLI